MLDKRLALKREVTMRPKAGPVKYSTAVKHLDQVFVEGQDICDITGKGTCGS